MSENKETNVEQITNAAAMDRAMDALVTEKVDNELSKLFPGPTNAIHVSRYQAQLLKLAADYKSTGERGGKMLELFMGVPKNTFDDVFGLFEKKADEIMASAEAEAKEPTTTAPLISEEAARGPVVKWLMNLGSKNDKPERPAA